MDGGVQELVETERSSTEILHMECKDTGEFAHRESTEYEQTEVFNKEVVSTEHGNEEYVHLKSQHDEYEHLESNMPKNRQRGGEEEAGAAEQPEPMRTRARKRCRPTARRRRCGSLDSRRRRWAARE